MNRVDALILIGYVQGILAVLDEGDSLGGCAALEQVIRWLKDGFIQD